MAAARREIASGQSGRIALALVSAVTLANAGCGFAAIFWLVGHPDKGPAAVAGLVFAAWVFDMLDGPLARRLHVSGRFGAMLDSLCDVVSFGLAPAVMIGALARPAADAGFTMVCGLIAAGYLAAAILRLARFTAAATTSGVASTPGPRVFAGLPSPAAAMSVAAALLVSVGQPAFPLVVAVLTGGLMLTRLPYIDLPALAAQRPLFVLLFALPLAIAAVWGVPLALSLFFTAYIASGPIWCIAGGAPQPSSGPALR